MQVGPIHYPLMVMTAGAAAKTNSYSVPASFSFCSLCSYQHYLSLRYRHCPHRTHKDLEAQNGGTSPRSRWLGQDMNSVRAGFTPPPTPSRDGPGAQGARRALGTSPWPGPLPSGGLGLPHSPSADRGWCFMNPEPQQDSPINLLVLLIKHHIRKCKFPNGLPSISEASLKSLLVMLVN